MDIQKLTLGEVSKVEELSGLPIGALGDDTKPKGKLLIALAYVIKRREDDSYRPHDAEKLTMDEVSELLGFDAGDDTDPKGE
tara:strand:+ start:5908 stop:6153 length:246 start_codon:yes stop_codon:yes gene_type:complete